MSDFEVLVYQIKEPVIDHPNDDRLSLIQIEGYTCISAKLEDGSHRYKQGDLVVYIPEMSVMPEWMMKDMDFWDVNKNKPAFKYVKAKKLHGIFSQGILYPIEDNEGFLCLRDPQKWMEVEENKNVAEFLNITKWEPIVPESMRV